MAEMSLPIQLRKLYGEPINPDSVFDTMLAATTYSNGPTGAAGEIISIRDENSFRYSCYVINGDKSLSKISANVTIVDDKGETIDVTMDDVVDTLKWKEI